MTIKDIVNTLQAQGMDVSFYVRKDGGVRITKIGEQTFRGSKGNAFARQMLGVSLSVARARALKKLKTPKGKGSYNKRRKTPLDEELRKRIRKIQSIYRQRGYSGKPSVRNYRYNLKHYGKEEADRLLRQSELYAQGIIYSANVQFLIDRITKIAEKRPRYSSKLMDIVSRLEGMKESMRYDPTYIRLIDDKGALYKMESGQMTIEDGIEEINKILDRN